MNYTFKKNIIIIIIAALLAFGIGGTAVGVGVANIPKNRISRYMDAAERYLSELNYEQAVIEFQKVLDIEPMNIDAVLGLADVYAKLGDTDKALEILNDGYEQTGEKQLKRRIDKLTGASAASPESNFEFTQSDNGLILTKYNGSDDNVVIPSQVGNDDVRVIGSSAFNGCQTIKSVTIPDTVVEIGNWAFADCRSLTQLNIPNGVTTIGGTVFYRDTSLELVTVPDSVTSIDNTAFAECLTSALYKGKLYDYNQIYEMINLINGVGTVVSSSTYYESNAAVDKLDYEYEETPNGIKLTKFIGYDSFADIVIPSEIDGKPVRVIGASCFSKCGVNSVVIPDGVIEIERSAFYYCSLMNEVVIPDSVTKIGDYAFSYCVLLDRVILPESVELGEGVFYSCYGVKTRELFNKNT